MDVPICTKCFEEHYRFIHCEDVEEWNAKHEALEKARQPPVHIDWGPPPKGFHEVAPSQEGAWFVEPGFHLPK